jgi:hypothetical protein
MCAVCSASQACGTLVGGATACCYPSGTTGVCTEDNFLTVCCNGPNFVGCDFSGGTPGRFFNG